MNEELSRINQVYESLGELITHNPDFEQVPVYWGLIELTANEMPPTSVVFENTPFRYDSTNCHFETQLDILIVHNTDYVREINKRLSKYSELLIKLLDEHIINDYTPYQLEFLNASEIRAMKNNRADGESYKGTKMLFSSLIVLSYKLRY